MRSCVGALALLLGAAVLYARVGPTQPADQAYSRRWQSEADGVVRFHVIANSDARSDQALKLRVRDGLREYLLRRPDGPEEVLRFTREHREDLERLAAELVKREGFAYPVRVETGRFTFPPSEADGLFLPSGDYQAVRVVIGNGRGQNWWCVLFPPMCFGVMGGDARPDASPPPRAQIRSAAIEWWRHVSVIPFRRDLPR